MATSLAGLNFVNFKILKPHFCQPLNQMKTKSNPLSDTYISHGMIIQGDLSSNTTLTIGLRLSGISYDDVSVLHCNNVENAWLSFLKSLTADYTVKTRYSKCGSYKPELKAYYDDTVARANDFSMSQRNARLCQINDSIEAKQIFRSESHLFLSRQLTKSGKRNSISSTDELDALLQAEAQAFAPIIEQARFAAQQSGGNCEALTDKELFLEFDKILNPSQTDSCTSETALNRFHPASSISDCSLQSDMIASSEADCGFFLDGHYHAIILLKSLPSVTTSGQILQLTNLPIKELSITTISRPLDLEAEITDEERRAQKLRRAASSSNKLRLHTSLAQSEERIAQLASGDASPCSFQMILHVWDKDPATLQQSKVPMLKSALTRFQGSKYYVVENPVMARDSFLTTLLSVLL